MAAPRFEYRAYLTCDDADVQAAAQIRRGLLDARLPAGEAPGLDLAGFDARRLTPLYLRAPTERPTDRLARDASEALVVVCSPRAAASDTVDEDILAFRRAGRGDRVFAIVVDGDPGAAAGQADACFPAALRTSHEGAPQDLEPLAADARAGRDGHRLAVLKIAAGLFGLPLDTLRNRDARRRRRRRLVAVVALAVVAVALGVLSFVASRNERRANARAITEQAAREAMDATARKEQSARREVEGLLAFMLGDLDKKLRPGEADLLREAADRAIGYYDAVDPTLRGAQDRVDMANGLRTLASVLLRQGRGAEAGRIRALARDVEGGTRR